MTLQELVHQAASLYSDKIAVCFDECNNQPPVYYTYKTVINAASALSNFLLLHCDFQGIREIGLYCHPTINLPSWVLGILQVPAAYAPVDPDSPPALSIHFMKKCNLKYILVEKVHISKFKSSYEALLNYDMLTVEHNDLVLFRLHWKNVEVSLVPNDRKEKYEKGTMTKSMTSESSSEEKSEEHMDVKLKHCLAYVLHTSGTTGIPKIVRVPHACIVPNIQHFRVLFEITHEDVLFLASPLTFDPSVVEIFVALSSGASLLIVPTSVKMVPSKLAAVLFSHHRVTILQVEFSATSDVQISVSEMTLQELVHQAASLYSDKIAVCFDECNNQPPVYYTYKTVINAASALSNFLLLHCDFQGIREIGLYCHPTINLPSWVLGILQVPAAYAPVDPDSPPALSIHFMKKCNLKYILVEKVHISKFKSSYEALLNYDMLTVEHNDLVLFRLHWKNVEVSLVPNDRKEKYEKGTMTKSMTSESSSEEKSEEHMDVKLKHCLAYVLHTSGTTGIPKIVRVPHACIVPNIQHFRCELPVQLGFPLLGTVVEVRDTNGFTIQEGNGQVFLGGRNRVCFLDGEMTVPLGTMRATGDFVTIKDGEIFFLGRKDSQIKRHGKRLNIELVQQIAEGLQQVESCAVTWYNQEKLILFMVTKNDLVKDYIFEELQKHLPSHAIPDELVLINSLPFTSHGKIDVSELNKIYLNYRDLKSECKLSGKEELWEKLHHLWKSVLSLSEDALKIPDESLFLNSGGDSLKSIRLLNEIENLVGTSVPGLLEILLSSSILEIYNHILQTVFSDKDLTVSKNHAMKRKFSDATQEEASGKSLHQEAVVPLNCDNESNAFIALSRGSQILSLNTDRYLTKLGHCPSTYSSDLNSQTDIQNRESLSTPPLVGKSEDPSCVVEVSEEDTPVIRAEKMEFRVRWRSDTGKCVDASPLLVIPALDKSSATVYIGSHSHRMIAVDLYSGKVKWEQILGDRIESSACVSKCGNFIVVGCYNGLVYVLKSNSGEKYWMFSTENAVKSSATLDPTTGLLYIGSHDQHAYALDIYKKKCVWKLKCGGTVFSSPCLSLIPSHLYFATLGGLLLAVNPATGDRVWKHSCGKPLFSSPRCCLQYIFIGCVDGNLLCFTHFGEQVWQFSTNEPIFSSPCTSASEQEIFFGSHDCFIYCCSMKGHLRWKFETTARVYSTPFVFRNHNHNNEMLLAAASTDGKLWILESKSGQLQSVYELPGEVFSSPVVWESMLIIGCRNNYVYCLDLLGDKGNEVQSLEYT